MWIQTGVTVRKRLNWDLTSVALTFDLWPGPFAWISFLSFVITPENFMMIRWWEHSEKGVTGGRTDGWTERSVPRAAWSQLKTIGHLSYATPNFAHHFTDICEFKLELRSGFQAWDTIVAIPSNHCQETSCKHLTHFTNSTRVTLNVEIPSTA